MSTELSIKDLEQKIHTAQESLNQQLPAITTLESFEKTRANWLGKHGIVTNLTDQFKSLPRRQRLKLIGKVGDYAMLAKPIGASLFKGFKGGNGRQLLIKTFLGSMNFLFQIFDREFGTHLRGPFQRLILVD